MFCAMRLKFPSVFVDPQEAVAAARTAGSVSRSWFVLSPVTEKKLNEQ